MKTVLFVDDDPYWSRYYQEEILKRYTLIYKKSADGAIAALTTEKKIDLLLLDIMMDTPDSVDLTETEGGLITGIWILEKLREVLLKGKIPVIVLTNRQKKLVVEAVASLKYPEGYIEVYSKAEMSARQLPSAIQARVER